jgi:hypothetical protein
MIPDWHADVTNDPSRDYDLCIELSQGSHVRGTVSRNGLGELVLMWFASETPVEVSAAWLAGILESAETELPKR